MRIEPSVGAGTLRPATKNVKKKVAFQPKTKKPFGKKMPSATPKHPGRPVVVKPGALKASSTPLKTFSKGPHHQNRVKSEPAISLLKTFSKGVAKPGKKVEPEVLAAAATIFLAQENAVLPARPSTPVATGAQEAPSPTSEMLERASRIPHDPAWKAVIEQCRQILAMNDRAEAMEAESLKDFDSPSLKPSTALAPPLPPDTYAVELSQPAGKLISWYCRITHHRPECVVEGIVCEALERAQEAYNDAEAGDDAFDIVLGDVLQAQCQGMENKPRLVSSPEAAQVQVDGKANCLLALFAIASNRSLKDVASAAIIHTLETVLGVNANEPTGAEGSLAKNKRRNEFYIACENAFQRRMYPRRLSA